jgi:hypothetical protein
VFNNHFWHFVKNSFGELCNITKTNIEQSTKLANDKTTKLAKACLILDFDWCKPFD